jgi:REP element-mobilizing transposase RayT
MEKFQNKYRIPSARAPFWDYGCNAPYFVTICTKDREHYFGKIIDGQMQLNEIGQIAQQCWLAITDHFLFVELVNCEINENF